MKFAALFFAFVFSLASSAYEICTPANSYIEDLLPPIAPFVSPMLPPALPMACVEAAHLSLPAAGFYGFCPTAAGRPFRTHPRPCVSERYVSAVHHAVEQAADCLGYDAKLAFATFNLESALHLTAVGAATDIGVGQLTKSAIDEVNLNALPRARRMAAASPRSSCAYLLPYMTEHPSGIDDRCGFMVLPENPERNVAYSILLLQQNRRVVDNLWNRLSITVPASVDVERLKVMLAMLAYNAGPGSVVSTLKAYTDQMGTALSPWHFNFESTSPEAFTGYLKEYFPAADPTVRSRVSKYLGHVMVAARRADGLAGGTRQCMHASYFEPILPPQLPPTLPPQVPTPPPDATQARHLVLQYAQLAADYLTENQDCRSAEHLLEYAFYPRDSRPSFLPELKCDE